MVHEIYSQTTTLKQWLCELRLGSQLLLELRRRFKLLLLLLSLWSAPTASDTLLNPSRSRHSASCCFMTGIRAGPSYAKAVYSSTRLAPALTLRYASSPDAPSSSR